MEDLKKMKKYLAIGHFKDSKNMTSVAMQNNTLKDFYNDLKGNEFVAYVVLSENKVNYLKNVSSFDLFNEVKKMTSNYRKWDDITEYIDQCYDIMKEKLANC